MTRSHMIGLNLAALAALAVPALLIFNDLDARAGFGLGTMIAFTALSLAGLGGLAAVMFALTSRKGGAEASALLPVATLSAVGAVAILVGLSFQPGV
jgi:hypothetical protein